MNANQAAAGVVGIALALPLGTSASLAPQGLVAVRFRSIGSLGTTTPLSLQDQPTVREIVDVYANALDTVFADGQLNIGAGSGPKLMIRASGKGIIVSWPSGGSDGYVLESATDIGAGLWSAVEGVAQTIGGTRSLSLPSPQGRIYFRLRRP